MENIDQLYLDVEDSIGLEAYNYYVGSGKKYAIVEEMVTAIAASVLFEFIKPFIDFEGIADQLKAQVKALFARDDSPNFQDLSEMKMLNEAIDFISKHPSVFNLDKKKAAEQKIKAYLLSINYPSQTAELKAAELTTLLYRKLSK